MMKIPYKFLFLGALSVSWVACTSEVTISEAQRESAIGGGSADLDDQGAQVIRDVGLAPHLDLGVPDEDSDPPDAFNGDHPDLPDSGTSDKLDQGAQAFDQGEPDLQLVDMELDQLPPIEPDQAPPPEPCGCYEGEGTYCASQVALYTQGLDCIPPEGLNDTSALMRCELNAAGEPVWAVETSCVDGCEGGELASADYCALPECECFVRVAWCGASAGRHGEEQLGCRVPLIPEHDNDILACNNGNWIVREPCEYGCLEQPTGTPDSCRLYPELGDETWPDCPSRPLLHSGLHPEASDRLRCAGVTASRITQTIGSAPASAGYHAADGTASGRSYCAAVDLRTRDLTTAQIRTLLDNLGRHGFAAWYRQPGADGWPSSQAPHIHAVFAGVRMKSQLRGQVRDFLENRNALSSHSIYRFWDIPVEIKALVEQLFRRHYTP